MQNQTALSVSPFVIEELMALLPKNLPPAIQRREVESWVQEILFQAHGFVKRFARIPDFFYKERWHQFVGLVFYHPQTKEVIGRFSFGLRFHNPELGIHSLKEVPKDEDYLIRQVIAEAQFPEYNDNRIPPMFFNR